MLNKATIQGNLTRDPESKYFDSGTCVVSFTIATSKKYKDKQGEMVEKTSFIDCKAWGKTGENFAKYHSKGQQALVEGEMEQETWETDGQKRSKIVINVSQWHFIGSKPSQSDGQQREPEQQSSAMDGVKSTTVHRSPSVSDGHGGDDEPPFS